MYTPDVVNLRQFYATPMGQTVQALIARSLQSLWPNANGDTVLGIGYCPPCLDYYVTQSANVMVCMPAHQGAAYWPQSQPNLVVLTHESELPFPENSINRILLMHSVEHSEQLSGMMAEIWRVLAPGGRVLAVAPNRHGTWSRSSKSPFGYGRPFSMAQLRDLMAKNNLTPTRTSSALFIPPIRLRALWRFATKIETLGKWICPFFGGVIMVEAEKQIYAAIRQPVERRKAYRLAPVPAPNPALGRQ